jgi:hypothetical protein
MSSRAGKLRNRAGVLVASTRSLTAAVAPSRTGGAALITCSFGAPLPR